MMAEMQSFQIEQDLGRVTDGQAAGRLAETLAPEFERRHRAVERKIYEKIMAGKAIDPQFALQCWIEKYELHRLERELGQRQRRGQSAAERVSGQMGTVKHGTPI